MSGNASTSEEKGSGGKKKPPQHQDHQPGRERKMHPKPQSEPRSKGGNRLRGRKALITGGDSGIGRAVAYAFANEGANVAIIYLEEDQDAKETKQRVEEYGAKCFLFEGDIQDRDFCRSAVQRAVRELGGLDILVNNAAEQHPVEDFERIEADQIEKTFRTNILSIFYLSQAALGHMKEGAAIINTTSVTAYRGSPHLVDYSSTKGAIVSFTRSLSGALAEKGIRVNAVAPGPIWTPLIPATFGEEKVAEFGKKVPMKRPGEPNEVAPAYVFLASEDASYMTGQVLHVNGGEIIGG